MVGAIQVLELISKTESGSTCPPNDFGLMGVIDGCELYYYIGPARCG